MNKDELERYAEIITEIGELHDGTIQNLWNCCRLACEAMMLKDKGWAEDIASRINREPSTVYGMVEAQKMRWIMEREFFDRTNEAARKGYTYFVKAWQYFQKDAPLPELLEAIEQSETVKKMGILLSGVYDDGNETDALKQKHFRRLEVMYQDAAQLGFPEPLRESLKTAYKMYSEYLRLTVN